MTTSAKVCEEHRREIFKAMSCKARWTVTVLVPIMLLIAGWVFINGKTQAANASSIKAHETSHEIQRKAAADSRKEQVQWQTRVAETLDDIKEHIFTHTHENKHDDWSMTP